MFCKVRTPLFRCGLCIVIFLQQNDDNNDNIDDAEWCIFYAWLQVLVVAAQSGDFAAQQHAFNRLSVVSVVSLYSHLRAARDAAFRRRVSLTN